jgi:hypothetical protein
MSNTYNPILQGDYQEVTSRIMMLLPDTSNNGGADHYRSSALSALEVIIGAFHCIGYLMVLKILNAVSLTMTHSNILKTAY